MGEIGEEGYIRERPGFGSFPRFNFLRGLISPSPQNAASTPDPLSKYRRPPPTPEVFDSRTHPTASSLKECKVSLSLSRAGTLGLKN